VYCAGNHGGWQRRPTLYYKFHFLPEIVMAITITITATHIIYSSGGCSAALAAASRSISPLNMQSV
jgi:hypothetical protein